MKLLQILTEETRITGVSAAALEYYTKVCDFLRSELQIPASTTIIVHVNSTAGLDKSQNGSTVPDLKVPNTIHVHLLPGLDRASLLRALCHEFVHVQQLASKRLILHINNGQLIGMDWDGRPARRPGYNRNSEWELEAHIKERTLLQSVIEKIGNLLT